MSRQFFSSREEAIKFAENKETEYPVCVGIAGNGKKRGESFATAKNPDEFIEVLGNLESKHKNGTISVEENATCS